MSERLRYEHGVDIEAAKIVAAEMRELEADDFLRTYDTVLEGLLDSVTLSAYVQTAYLDDHPIAIFGLSKRLPNGTCAPWLALTEKATEHPILVLREADRFLENHKGVWSNLMNWVPCEDEEAHRLLDYLGFHVRRDEIRWMNRAPYYQFTLGSV